MSSVDPADRVRLIGDAAIVVLAHSGGRGLTHRAVDRELGWPEGTTSRYFRTRDALLEAAVARLLEIYVVELETWERAQRRQTGTTKDDVARIMTRMLESWVGAEGRPRQIARYELSLEGQRRIIVREAIVDGRRQLNASVARLLQLTGCSSPDLHATALVSYLDGFAHDHILHPAVGVEPAAAEDLLHRWLESC